MPKLAILLRGRAAPGQRDAIYKLYEEHLAPRARANAAQPIVVWCADDGDPDAFYLWEVYAESAAMQANAQSAWFAEYMAAVAPLLAGQPDVSMATPVWVKPALA